MRDFILILVGSVLILSCQKMSSWSEEEVLTRNEKVSDTGSIDSDPVTDTVSANGASTDSGIVSGTDSDSAGMTGKKVHVSAGVPGMFTEIYADNGFTCGIDTEGRGQCWGKNTIYRKSAPDDLIISSVVGDDVMDESCALTERGTVWCQGSRLDDNPTPTGEEQFLTIAAGDGVHCGLCVDGKVNCWGGDDIGREVVFGDSADYVSIAVGTGHVCALQRNGLVECRELSVPDYTIFEEGEAFTQIVAGAGYTCGLKTTGAVVCDEWMRNETPGDEEYIQLSSGTEHVCGLRNDGIVNCWGNNGYGQSSAPLSVRFVQIDVGAHHSCGIRDDGAAVCWGDDSHGQATPPGGDQFTQIASGAEAFCGLLADGRIKCWGIDVYDMTSPTQRELFSERGMSPLPEDEKFVQLVGGEYYFCGLRFDGGVRCWGDKIYGPLDISEEYVFNEIATSGSQLCGIEESGGVYCWNGDTSKVSLQSDDAEFVRLSSGYSCICGLQSNGNMRCWSGYDFEPGICGINNADFVQMDIDDEHGCGVRADGSVSCWSLGLEKEWVAPNEEVFSTIAVKEPCACGIVESGLIRCFGNDLGSPICQPPAEGDFSKIFAVSVGFCALRAADGVEVCWGHIVRNMWQ